MPAKVPEKHTERASKQLGAKEDVFENLSVHKVIMRSSGGKIAGTALMTVSWMECNFHEAW